MISAAHNFCWQKRYISFYEYSYHLVLLAMVRNFCLLLSKIIGEFKSTVAFLNKGYLDV